MKGDAAWTARQQQTVREDREAGFADRQDVPKRGSQGQIPGVGPEQQEGMELPVRPMAEMSEGAGVGGAALGAFRVRACCSRRGGAGGHWGWGVLSQLRTWTWELSAE